MGSSWFIKGIGYLLIAVFLGIVLWIIRLRPKKVKEKRKKVLKKRKPIKKRRPAKKRGRK